MRRFGTKDKNVSKVVVVQQRYLQLRLSFPSGGRCSYFIWLAIGLWLLMPQFTNADLVVARTINVRGFTIKIGPMVQTVNDREQLVKYFISSHGVRVEAIMGLERRLLVFNYAQNKIWTIDSTESSYIEGALDDYRARLKKHPEERTNVVQDLPIVSLVYTKSPQRGRLKGKICQLVQVKGVEQTESRFCIASFKELGLSATEALVYRAFLRALASHKSEALDTLVPNWKIQSGAEGIDIFGMFSFKVSGLPVRSQVSIRLASIETRPLGSNLFIPPPSYHHVGRGLPRGSLREDRPNNNLLLEEVASPKKTDNEVKTEPGVVDLPD
jgi:hypothetical protein